MVHATAINCACGINDGACDSRKSKTVHATVLAACHHVHTSQTSAAPAAVPPAMTAPMTHPTLEFLLSPAAAVPAHHYASETTSDRQQERLTMNCGMPTYGSHHSFNRHTGEL
jgi:hypothetical protein